jgi:long-chain fatty acid transport protein
MKKIVLLGLTFFTTQVFASGFSKPVNVGPKAIGMGGAFVGVADDTTAIFHNPAGMSQLKADHNIQLGADTLITQLDYEPPAGAVESAKKEYLPVPTFGYVNRQLKMISLGVGVFFPHGNGGKFDATPASFSPANPNEGRIYSMEIAPAVAFEVVKGLSLGGSLRATRISTSLKGQLIQLAPATFDNLEELSTSGWGYGASGGFLAQPAPWLRIGGNYRSKITKTLSGDGTFTGLGNFDAKFKITLPTLVTGGFAAQATEKLLFAFQYGYERNSEVKNFVVSSPDLGGAPATLTLPQNWKDSHTFHFGTKLDVCKTVSLVGGYARDFNKSIPDAAMNRVTGDIDAHEASGGLLLNVGKYNAGLVWNGRWGQRDIPVTATNISPGHYDAFLHTISANVGVSL